MKEVREMIESAPTKKMAREMLNTFKIFGNINEKQYEKGRELIRKEFGSPRQGSYIHGVNEVND